MMVLGDRLASNPNGNNQLLLVRLRAETSFVNLSRHIEPYYSFLFIFYSQALVGTPFIIYPFSLFTARFGLNRTNISPTLVVVA